MLNISRVAWHFATRQPRYGLPELKEALGLPRKSRKAADIQAACALSAEILRIHRLRVERAARKPAQHVIAPAADRYAQRHPGQIETFAALIRSRYRTGTRSKIIVRLVSETGGRWRLGASTSQETDRTVYRGAWKGWEATIYEHYIGAAPGAVSGRYHSLGIQVVDGMVTVAASRISAPAGAEVYRAVWIEQGRGCELRTGRGYIAVARHENGTVAAAVHGATIRASLATLRRRLASGENHAPVAVQIARTIAAERLYDAVQRAVQVAPSAPVSVAMARAMGYCVEGIRHYCRRANLDAELAAGRTTVWRLADALSRVWDPLAARLLIRAAIARRRELAQEVA